ncbi:MAG TPA: ATP-binding domain-containing protein, partial [Acidimicrobiia bacterium]|nr:ATP-binding domain-containing protein [Acidimicrobiia bacterium]
MSLPEADSGREALARTDDLEAERAYVESLYARLAEVRAKLDGELGRVRGSPGGTHQWRQERDALATNLENRLAALDIGDLPLCFGRLDMVDRARYHVGRLGLSSADYEPLLIDWRAPAAQPFYRATAADPQNVVLRRHLLTHGREVVGLDDEVFDLDALSETDRAGLHGDAALLAALRKGRTGRMGDIVATIQAEQDRVIRSDLPGVLVVEGGPGTGKTAVALHRAAYLLYTHRTRLAGTGVLVVGPNAVFLRYIEQVLPSLGETGVMLATPGELYPGVTARRHDAPLTAQVKSDLRMVKVLRRAVADRQRVPREDLRLQYDNLDLVLDRATCQRARDAGRRSSRPHNPARETVERILLAALVDQIRAGLTELRGSEPEPDELDEAWDELRRSRDFRFVMERIWPILSAAELLNDLFGTPALVKSAGGPVLDAAEREALHRERSRDLRTVEWSIEDVPLLDEAAELLGVALGRAQRAARRRAGRRRRGVRFAQAVLEGLRLDIPIDPGLLAARYAGEEAVLTVAERARLDRTWEFGHVIVDEAQELSPMAWRVLFRRCPSRSMTVVGDLAQTGAPWGPATWAEVFDRHAASRWRRAELTVNYRTPSEIMEVATAVLASAAPGVVPPRSMREEGVAPWAVACAPGEVVTAVADAVRRELAAIGDGRVAVIAPAGETDKLASGLEEALPEVAVGDRSSPLDGMVAVLGVAETKGLEFDGVIVVEPAAITRESDRGFSDLYVALTRATRRLGVVHSEAL